MSAPNVVPSWATDATYTSGPDVGENTKLAFTSGEQANGFMRDWRAPPRKMNWLLGLICSWIGYLNSSALAAMVTRLRHGVAIGNTLTGAEVIAYSPFHGAWFVFDENRTCRYAYGAGDWRQPANAGLTAPTGGVANGVSAAIDPNTGLILAGVGSGSASTTWRLARSADAGKTWTSITLPSSVARPRVFHDGEQFIIKNNHDVFTYDGTTLTEVDALFNLIAGAGDGAGHFVGLNNDGTPPPNSPQYTEDHGVTWEASGLPGTDLANSVAWSESLGLWVAAGSESSVAAIWTTNDPGGTWIQRTLTFVDTVPSARTNIRNLVAVGPLLAAVIETADGDVVAVSEDAERWVSVQMGDDVIELAASSGDRDARLAVLLDGGAVRIA